MATADPAAANRRRSMNPRRGTSRRERSTQSCPTGRADDRTRQAAMLCDRCRSEPVAAEAGRRLAGVQPLGVRLVPRAVHGVAAVAASCSRTLHEAAWRARAAVQTVRPTWVLYAARRHVVRPPRQRSSLTDATTTPSHPVTERDERGAAVRTEVRIAATTPAAAERARQLGYRVEWMGVDNGYAVERPGGAAWTDDGVDWFLRMASVAHAMRAGRVRRWARRRRNVRRGPRKAWAADDQPRPRRTTDDLARPAHLVWEGIAGPTPWRRSRTSRSIERAGATGLEPATSGVTGHFQGYDGSRRGHEIAVFMRFLGFRFRMVEPSDFRLLLPVCCPDCAPRRASVVPPKRSAFRHPMREAISFTTCSASLPTPGRKPDDIA